MRGQITKVLTRWAHANAHATRMQTMTRSQAKEKQRQSFLWGIALGGVVGGVSAVGLAIYSHYRERNVILNQADDNSFVITAKPPFDPSRSVKFRTDPTTGLKLTLFQYQTCPFCCKVRATLNSLGVSYNVVEVNPVLRTQLKWSEKYKKVPILIVETPEGEILQLNDSSMIISVIYSYVMANSSNNGKELSQSHTQEGGTIHQVAKSYPLVKYTNERGTEESDIMNKYFLMFGDSDIRNKEEIISERKWRSWADSVYVHTLSPNIYRTMPESLDSFRYFDKVGEWETNFKTWERILVIYVGAFAMWIVGKRLQKRHNLNEDVRQSLYDESNYWLFNVKKNGGDFMGGSKPNLADLAVFGVLNSIEGCQAFQDLNQNSLIVKEWYYKVKKSLQLPLDVPEG